MSSPSSSLLSWTSFPISFFASAKSFLNPSNNCKAILSTFVVCRRICRSSHWFVLITCCDDDSRLQELMDSGVSTLLSEWLKLLSQYILIYKAHTYEICATRSNLGEDTERERERFTVLMLLIANSHCLLHLDFREPCRPLQSHLKLQHAAKQIRSLNPVFQKRRRYIKERGGMRQKSLCEWAGIIFAIVILMIMTVMIPTSTSNKHKGKGGGEKSPDCIQSCAHRERLEHNLFLGIDSVKA